MTLGDYRIIRDNISKDQVIRKISSEKKNSLSQNKLPNSQCTPQELAAKAITILESLPSDGDDESTALSPDYLHRLLSTIIKPLFSVLKNPALSASGRKNLLPTPDPTGSRFDAFSSLDEASKPWKFAAPWSVSLLIWIVFGYGALPERDRYPALEAHFPLLVPPLLSLIDDDAAICKAQGCVLLEHFASYLAQNSRSNLFERTGLADVFIDTLVPNMSLLPTLTPEDESLLVLGTLYPAFRASIQARFPATPNSTISPQSPSPTSLFALTPRQKALNTLLRHGILHSFPYTLDSHPKLTALLLNELALTLSLLGIDAVRYLRDIIPLSQKVLTNPFALAARQPGRETITAGLRCLRATLRACGDRIRISSELPESKSGTDVGEGAETEAKAKAEVEAQGHYRRRGWAVEILRICIACWLLVVADDEDEREGHGHHHAGNAKAKAKAATEMKVKDAKGAGSGSGKLRGGGDRSLGYIDADESTEEGQGQEQRTSSKGLSLKAEIRRTVKLLRRVVPELELELDRDRDQDRRSGSGSGSGSVGDLELLLEDGDGDGAGFDDDDDDDDDGGGKRLRVSVKLGGLFGDGSDSNRDSDSESDRVWSLSRVVEY